MDQWKPVTKVLAAFVASAVVFAAVQLGVEIPDKDVKEAALAFAGVVVAYLVKG